MLRKPNREERLGKNEMTFLDKNSKGTDRQIKNKKKIADTEWQQSCMSNPMKSPTIFVWLTQQSLSLRVVRWSYLLHKICIWSNWIIHFKIVFSSFCIKTSREQRDTWGAGAVKSLEVDNVWCQQKQKAYLSLKQKR